MNINNCSVTGNEADKGIGVGPVVIVGWVKTRAYSRKNVGATCTDRLYGSVSVWANYRKIVGAVL
jgi:hypothetical protein